jgi:hypothetical protein
LFHIYLRGTRQSHVHPTERCTMAVDHDFYCSPHSSLLYLSFTSVGNGLYIARIAPPREEECPSSIMADSHALFDVVRAAMTEEWGRSSLHQWQEAAILHGVDPRHPASRSHSTLRTRWRPFSGRTQCNATVQSEFWSIDCRNYGRRNGGE